MEELKMQDVENPSTPAGQSSDEKVDLKQFLRDLLETLLLAVVLYVGINALSARVRVDGFSMRPTLDDGEFILVNRVGYKFWDVARGDIIVFAHPAVPDQELIKRVIGLPGDMVIIKNGQVLVNGVQLHENYIAAPPQYDGEWQVPDQSVFVLGDNRNDSSDSHSWGMLPLKNIVGKAVLIYWPPSEWSLMRHIDPLTAQ